MRSFASLGEQGRDGESCISFQNLVGANAIEEGHFPEGRQAGSWSCFFFLRLSVIGIVYIKSKARHSNPLPFGA